jgi:hypothetical protein
MAYKYCVKENWGKSFFTHEERKQMYLAGHPGNVWVVDDNIFGDNWISKVVGTTKTKAEAQAIVDGEVETAQAAWDAESDEYKAQYTRPVKYNLP